MREQRKGPRQPARFTTYVIVMYVAWCALLIVHILPAIAYWMGFQHGASWYVVIGFVTIMLYGSVFSSIGMMMLTAYLLDKIPITPRPACELEISDG